jgi:hypothetical protein
MAKTSWGKLDKNSGTSDVYIVDKKRNLEGKKRRVIKKVMILFIPPN